MRHQLSQLSRTTISVRADSCFLICSYKHQFVGLYKLVWYVQTDVCMGIQRCIRSPSNRRCPLSHMYMTGVVVTPLPCDEARQISAVQSRDEDQQSADDSRVVSVHAARLSDSVLL